MKNLQESLEGLNQHYLELLKNLNRVLDVNIEMLHNQKFEPVLYGECVVVEDIINAFEVKLKEDSIVSIARFQPLKFQEVQEALFLLLHRNMELQTFLP